MGIHHLARNALIMSFVAIGLVTGASHAQAPSAGAAVTPKELAAAVQEVTQMEAALTKATRAHDDAGEAALYADRVVDIHASGWMYTKNQSLTLARNTAKVPNRAKSIKSERVGPDYVAFSKDAVAVTWMSTTYYEIPNPQDLAAAAGTITEDPGVLEKLARSRSIYPGPGEMPTPNPYRVRSMRLWLRINGHWQIAASTATKIGQRAVPGLIQ